MKILLTSVVAIALVLSGAGLASAQSNPCIAGSETNCSTASGPPFTIQVSTPTNGWPYLCLGEMASVSAVPSLTLGGLNVVTATNENCAITTTTNPLSPGSIVTSSWFATNGSFSASGSGLTATFAPTDYGAGTLLYSMTYKTGPACGGANLTVTMTNTYHVSVLQPIAISEHQTNHMVTLKWASCATLESTSLVNGQWSAVSNVTSPYTFTPSGEAVYYRAKGN